MNLTLKHRSEITSKLWDDFVLSHCDATYFGTVEWLEGILSIQKWQLEDYSFGVFWDGKLVATVPMQWSPLTKSLMCSGWGWCPPLISVDNEKLTKFVFQEIDRLAERLKACDTKLGSFGHVSTNGSNLTQRGLSPALFYGFSDISSCTQIISLKDLSEEDLLKGLSQTARHTIRKAENNLRVERVTWRDHLDSYYKLHTTTYEQSQLPPHPFRYFEMISELAPENHKLFAAFNKEENVVAYHNDLHFKSAAFYHTATSSFEGNKQGAHYLLTWSAIAYARKKGCSVYEMGEIPLGTKVQKHETLGFFKTRFGGSPHRMLRFQKCYNWTPRLTAFKECIRSMQNFLNKMLGK